MKLTRTATTSILLVLFAAALLGGCTSGPASSQQNPALLEGPNWTATQLRGSSGTLAPVVPGSEISAVFKAGAVSGKGSVNQYNATYSVSGKNAITFKLGSTTLMAGPPPLMTQETNYFTALGEAKSYMVSADKLSLLDTAGQPLVVYAAKAPVALTGQTWYCTGYNNGKQAVVSLVDSTPITAVFGVDKTLSGSSGVNTYNTGYTVDGSKMTIAPEIRSTQMAGPEPLMAQEQAYLAALPTTTRYEINGDELILWNGDARVAGYRLTK